MRRLLLLAACLALAIATVSCGGGSDGGNDVSETSWPRVQELDPDAEITPLPQNSQIEVGDSRFTVGLLNKGQELILDGEVTARFYKIEGEEGTLKGEAQMQFRGLQESIVQTQDDGTLRTVPGAEVGAYVANYTFTEAGDWGAVVEGSAGSEQIGPVRVRFNVLEQGTVTGIGDPAPRSEQLTLDDVDDIALIDSSNPPHPELHNQTLAEALDKGRPILLAIATPAFCTSRLCGPIVDEVVVPLFEEYGDRAEFVHIEPYDLAAAHAGSIVAVPALADWGIQTEPWIFVIDREGRIAARFEGITTVEEVEPALQAALE